MQRKMFKFSNSFSIPVKHFFMHIQTEGQGLKQQQQQILKRMLHSSDICKMQAYACHET